MDKTTWIVVAIFAVLLLLCICTCTVGGAAIWMTNTNNPTSNPTPSPSPWVENPWPTDEAGTPLPPTPAPPLPAEANETLDALAAAQVPDANLHDLAVRFMGVPASTPRQAATTNPDYAIGTRHTFNVSDVDTDEQFEITAVLVYKTAHVYMWVEEGVNVDERRLKQAADLFESHTYPTDREFFGSEWTPGVDGDPHLSILHARGLGRTVAGYFSSPDEYVRAVRSDSNEMEMFYINIQNVTVGDDFYNGVLAHEFQHMIHWYNDQNEETWLNEGCSELATELNARTYDVPGTYDVGGSDYAYLMHPDTQLTTWPEGTAGDASANYGAAYLFVAYFLDRFGEDATKSLVSHPENGMESFNTILHDTLGLDLTNKDIFADWTIANLLDDPTVGDGQYSYAGLDIMTPDIDVTYEAGDYPVNRGSSVHQYGVDYIEVNGDQPLSFTFRGSNQVGLMDTQAHSGQYLWWSNRNDESDTRLSLVADLTDASEATLRFWTWYYIEEDWDYAYVVVGSTADGTLPNDLNSPEISWDILDDASLHCIATDPNGNSFGCGFTGQSNGWQQLEADLSAYAGKEIVVNFEYITDAAVNQPGFAVDDVEIEADGATLFFDDMESGSGDWIAEGFVHHANILPQEWIVQLVTFGPETQVQRLLMADDSVGQWTIPLGGNTRRAIIVISALAPVTTESANYEYTLSQE